MIKMGKESKLSPSKVVEKAVEFFGPSGAGLELVDQTDCGARFEGAGGYVFVQAADMDDKEGSDATVEGREWEYQIREFMGEI